MQDCVENYLFDLQDKAERTAKNREQAVKSFLEWFDGDDVTEATHRDVKGYLRGLSDNGYADGTVKVHYDALVQLFDSIETQRGVEIVQNPTENFKLSDMAWYTDATMKKQNLRENDGIVYLTPEEKEKLADNVPAPELRNELIIRLLYQTGLREHELRNLRLDDVKRHDRKIMVWSDKTGDSREVAYHPTVETLLNRWIDGGYRDGLGGARNSEYLFVTGRSEKMGRGRVNTVVRKAADNAGIQEEIGTDAKGHTRYKITAHTLRHTFAVQSLKNGMSVRFLQKLMGHADITTTERYLEITDNDAIQEQRERGAGTEPL